MSPTLAKYAAPVLALILTLVVGFGAGRWSTSGNTLDLTRRAASAETAIGFQTEAIKAAAAQSADREALAKSAMALARSAGQADRAAASSLLALRLPDGADACASAQALINQAVKENR